MFNKESLGNWKDFVFSIMEKECPICHRKMSVGKYVDETTVIMTCKHCCKEFRITYDEEEIPRNINDFNWGAFFLWHLWGFWNGIPLLSCFGIFIGFLAAFFYPLYILDIAISLYLGLRGNRLSWRKKNWVSAVNFERCQKKWDIAVAVSLCLALVCGFLYGFCA